MTNPNNGFIPYMHAPLIYKAIQCRLFIAISTNLHRDSNMDMMLMNAGLSLLVLWVLGIPPGAWSESYPQKYEPASMKERFENWLKRYSREYGSEDEWQRRFGIYSSNVQYIDYINSQNVSFKITDNKFADLSNEEFISTYLGYNKLYNEPRWPSVQYLGLPARVDWRKEGAVTPVKDQGQCGM